MILKDKNDKKEIRIAGFGGQGVILGGIIIGKAASIFEHNYSTLIQSFGPEARGGLCCAQVIISSSPIMYPYIKNEDILIVMSQESYKNFSPRVKSGGTILYESDLVTPKNRRDDLRLFGIPATKIAEEIRSKILLNIVMLGFLTATTGVIDTDAMKKSIKDSVPKGTEKFNFKAFDTGYEKGLEAIRR